MSWLSSLGHDVANVWNDQPNWAKGLEIGGAATIATLGLADFAAPALFGGVAGAEGAGAAAAGGAGFDLATLGPGVTEAGEALTGADAAAGGAGALGFAGADAAGGGIDAINTALGISGGTDATSALSLAAPDAAAPLGTTAGAAAGAPLSLTGDTGYDLSTIGPGVSSTGGAVTGAGASGTAGATPTFLDKLIGGASNSLTKNPLGIAVAAGGLGLSALRGNQTDPNQKALEGEAPQLLAQGGALTASGLQLQTYLTSGTLPPALQSQVQSAVDAEKARIIQNHASNGENTNPTQNSALAAELAQADINGINLAGQQEQQLFQAGTQLLQTGVNETGLSTQLYETLAKMDEANTTQLMLSIASMAAALGGGTRIQIGGSSTATA